MDWKKYFLAISIFLGCSYLAESKSLAERIGTLNDQNTATEVAEKVFRRLDQIENAFKTAWRWTRSHRRLVKAGTGSD